MKYSVLIRDDDNSKKIEEYIKKNIIYSYDENNQEIVIDIGGDGT